MLRLPKKCMAVHIRNCILIGLIFFLYAFDSPFASSVMPNHSLYIYFKIFLWIGTIVLVFVFPKVKSKAKRKFTNEIKLWAFNLAVIYIIVLLAAGIIDGYGKSPYSHAFIDMVHNMFMVGLVLTGREMIRHYLVNSSAKEENYFVFIIVTLIMTVTNIPLHQFFRQDGYVSMIKFAAGNFAPEFVLNLLATYLVFLSGPLASVIYLGMIQAFHWLCPVLPDLKWITKALIGILCPLYSFMFIQSMYLSISKQLKHKGKEDSLIGWGITSIVSISIIWFAVGVFPVYPSVVATGSMEPQIKPGDVILIKKIDDGKDVTIGDIIQFRKNNIFISHRIIDVVEQNNQICYRTKGDNNSIPDKELVRMEQLKGKVLYVIPKIGWPTLLIKSKREIPLEKVEF